MKFRANITVALRPDISDPQGQTVERALPDLGWDNVERIRMGRHFVVTLDAPDAKSASEQIDKMSQAVLTNPILETYEFAIEEL